MNSTPEVQKTPYDLKRERWAASPFLKAYKEGSCVVNDETKITIIQRDTNSGRFLLICEGPCTEELKLDFDEFLTNVVLEDGFMTPFMPALKFNGLECDQIGIYEIEEGSSADGYCGTLRSRLEAQKQDEWDEIRRKDSPYESPSLTSTVSEYDPFADELPETPSANEWDRAIHNEQNKVGGA
jgi:hypothetical protein